MKYYAKVNGKEHVIEVVERLGELLVKVNGEPLKMQYREIDDGGQVALVIGNRSYGVSIDGGKHKGAATIAGQRYNLEIEDERERAASAAARARGGKGGDLKSVMPGVVVKLLVQEGQAVKQGQPMLILEAMKMQNEIGAPTDGVIKQIYVSERQAVGSGEKLIKIAADGA